ncbi:MAG TPA: hypothetical protein PKD37_02245 [Oligoflexia bacterium]|nr:hypothetical protein [Oligoflexia bacterium]HMP26791.1 hypothetical protein [Oligoflexia bacterium]
MKYINFLAVCALVNIGAFGKLLLAEVPSAPSPQIEIKPSAGIAEKTPLAEDSRFELPTAALKDQENLPDSIDQFLRWQLANAEDSFRVKPTIDNRAYLLMAYEKVVAKLCMPQLLNSLRHAGSPSDPLCLDYIQRVLKLHPGNSVAICARDGIDSKNCLRASELDRYEVFAVIDSPQSDSFNPLAGSFGSVDKELGSSFDDLARIIPATGIQEQSDKIEKRLKDIFDVLKRGSQNYNPFAPKQVGPTPIPLPPSPNLREHPQKNEQTNRLELEAFKLAFRLASLNCKNYKIKLTGDTNTGYPQAFVNEDFFQEQTAMPTPDQNRFVIKEIPNLTRIYATPSRCGQKLAFIESGQIGFSETVCFQKGWYSIKCIAALREKRRKQEETKLFAGDEQGQASETRQGLEEF